METDNSDNNKWLGYDYGAQDYDELWSGGDDDPNAPIGWYDDDDDGGGGEWGGYDVSLDGLVTRRRFYRRAWFWARWYLAVYRRKARHWRRWLTSAEYRRTWNEIPF